MSGDHSDKVNTYKTVKKEIINSLKELQKLSTTQLIKKRMDKFCNMGIVK